MSISSFSRGGGKGTGNWYESPQVSEEVANPGIETSLLSVSAVPRPIQQELGIPGHFTKSCQQSSVKLRLTEVQVELFHLELNISERSCMKCQNLYLKN